MFILWITTLVAAVLIGTAASDIFTQDVEDLPYINDGEDAATGNKGNRKANRNGSGYSGNADVRMATDKQIAYIKRQLAQKKISQDRLFKEWEEDFDKLEDIPFSEVNDILDWIQEQ